MAISMEPKTSGHQLELLPSNAMGSSTFNGDERSGLCKELIRHQRIVYYCLGLTMMTLLTGFDTVVIGTITALPYFQ
jgi:hypothetical protein